jgi:alpha-D-xyloside xylohydrolase
LAAPVLQDDHATTAYLPLGATWFEWVTATTHPGGTTLQLANVALAVVPVFARAGSVVPLAAPVEWTDALPGGPLRVAVYAGADAEFTLSEDDGDTVGYASGAVATTVLAWSDATQCLSWTRGGAEGAGGAQAFTQLSVTAYLLSGAVVNAAAVPIGSGGSVCPK